MPTPLEILLDPVSLVVIAIYAAFIAWEAVAPARRLPDVPRWRLVGLASFGVYFYLSSYLPLLWDGHLTAHQLLDLSALGNVGGTVVAVLLYELGVYVWHRAIHASTPLWRGFHQMHHAAERLDTWGTFFFSPLDMIGWTLLGSLVLSLGIGVTPAAATATLLITTLLSVFQHTNVRTPRWLGYLVQRPESHSVHHERGAHAKNYSDLPIFDLLFGTFENPTHFVDETGFYDGASSRVLDMLLAKDVSEPAVDEIAADEALDVR